MKKTGLIFIIISILVFTMIVPAFAENVLTEGFKFDIQQYNSQIKGERNLFINSEGQGSMAGKWSIVVPLEKIDENLYRVRKDAYGLGGKDLADTELEGDKAVLIVHSAFATEADWEENTDPSVKFDYHNIPQRNAATELKEGTFLVIEFPTLETGENGLLTTYGSAVYYAEQPTDETTDPAGDSSEDATTAPESESVSSEAQAESSGEAPVSSSDSVPPETSDKTSLIVLAVIATVSIAGCAVMFGRKRMSK